MNSIELFMVELQKLDIVLRLEIGTLRYNGYSDNRQCITQNTSSQDVF